MSVKPFGILRVIFVLSLAAASALAVGCDMPVWGNGDPVTRERELAAFTAIELSTTVDIDVEVAGTDGAPRRIPPGGVVAQLRCDSNLVDRIDTVVEGGVLVVRAEDDADLQPRSTCALVVETDRLQSLAIFGPGTIAAHGRLTDLREVDLEGPAELSADDIASSELVVRVEGPAELALAGVVDRLDVDLEGPVQLDAEPLAATAVDLVAEGPVQADVRARESCTLQLEGPVELDIWGAPRFRDVDVAGPTDVQFH